MSVATNSKPSSAKHARTSVWLAALALALALALAPVAVRADSGGGEAPRYAWSEGEFTHPLDSIHAPPMERLGPEAIRFSTAPALGGHAYVITLRPRGEDDATVEVVWLYGHAALGWRRTRAQTLRISRGLYDDIAGEVDAELTYGDDRTTTVNDEGDEEEAILVCSDGPGYLIERRHDGITHWNDETCGDTANDRINYILTSRLFARLGR